MLSTDLPGPEGALRLGREGEPQIPRDRGGFRAVWMEITKLALVWWRGSVPTSMR